MSRSGYITGKLSNPDHKIWYLYSHFEHTFRLLNENDECFYSEIVGCMVLENNPQNDTEKQSIEEYKELVRSEVEDEEIEIVGVSNPENIP